MAGMVAAVRAAAVTTAPASCTRPPVPAPSEEEPTLNAGGPAAKRCRGLAPPMLVAAAPEQHGGHPALSGQPQAAAPPLGRPPRLPAGTCPLRQRQATQGQAALSAQLLARLPRAPAAALLQRHPLLPRLCSILDCWATLSRELGIPPQLHLPPPVLVEAAAWLLQLGTGSQAVLAGRPQELCLVVAAAASANQQLHEQLARTMLLLKGVEDHAQAQGARQAQQQPHKSSTGSPAEPGGAVAAAAPPVPCLREIRTQLRARCWEHLQVQQPAVAERLLSKLTARHAEQKRLAAERAQRAQRTAAVEQQPAGKAHMGRGEASLPPASPARPLEPASSSSDERSASTASTASLEQQPQRELQEHQSPATPDSATSAATDRAALTPLERRVLELLRSDAGVAARIECFLLAEQAAAAAGPSVAPAGRVLHKRKSSPSQRVA